MVDAAQPIESQQAPAPAFDAPSTEPASNYDNATPQNQVARDVAAEPVPETQSAPVQTKQPISYQNQIS